MTKKAQKKHYSSQAFLDALGRHCRLLREKKGLSVNRLAREGSRLSPSVIIRLESASGPVTILTLKRIADVLQIHPKELLAFEIDELLDEDA